MNGIRALGRARATLVVEARGIEPAGAIGSALGVSRCIRLRQVHGARVLTASEAARIEQSGDALVASSRSGGGVADLAVAVVTADCVPLLLATRDGRLVSAVHAGWRGAAAGVVRAAVAALVDAGGSPEDMCAFMGPAAGGCCYEVGPEVVTALSAAAPGSEDSWLRPGRGERPHVDLRSFVATELGRLGLDASAIARHEECTICVERWPSYRRQGRSAERIWSAVAPAP